jgi:hypothetical protein
MALTPVTKEIKMTTFTPADFELTQEDFDAHPGMSMEAIQDLYYQDVIANEAMAEAEGRWEDSGCN